MRSALLAAGVPCAGSAGTPLPSSAPYSGTFNNKELRNPGHGAPTSNYATAARSSGSCQGYPPCRLYPNAPSAWTLPEKQRDRSWTPPHAGCSTASVAMAREQEGAATAGTRSRRSPEAGQAVITSARAGSSRRVPQVGRGNLLALQRGAGNAAVAAMIGSSIAVQRRAGSGYRDCGYAANDTALDAIQRQELQSSTPEHEEALAKIQGGPMYDLLPQLAALDAAVRSDEQAARKAGGPRLVLAERAVKSRGNWQPFALNNATEIAELPIDQIGDLMRFVGAPATVRLFDRADFDDRFDGMVDPTTGTITLIMRVRFEPVEGQTYSGDPVGSEAWERNNQKAFAAFGPKFKAAVESAWSKSGPVKPTCPDAHVAPFATRISVRIVESNEHLTVKLYGATAHIDSNIEPDLRKGETSRKGSMSVGDTDLRPTSHKLPNGTTLTSAQVAAAHEFGHAMGLRHVACDQNSAMCYGTTQAQYDDIMGGGMSVGSMSVGSGKDAHVHDDLRAFEKIGERWGQDLLPGPLGAKCNKWAPA
jgi:hypothetical protein